MIKIFKSILDSFKRPEVKTIPLIYLDDYSGRGKVIGVDVAPYEDVLTRSVRTIKLKVKDPILRKQEYLHRIAKRTKKFRIRKKLIKRIVDLYE